MSKRVRAIVSCVIIGLMMAVVAGYVLLTGPHGKLTARAERKNGGGYPYTVTVRQFGGRYNISLIEERRIIRDLLLSSYEFHEGSYPVTNAIIAWPELHSFVVSFDNGITVDCSWDNSRVNWTRH